MMRNKLTGNNDSERKRIFPLLEPLENRRLLDASGLFETPTTSPLISAGNEVISTDINNDGHNDLVIAHNTGLLILINNGQGSFSQSYTYDTDPGLGNIITSDLNNDTIPDIAAASGTGSDLHIFLGTGDGTFTYNGKLQNVPDLPSALDAADMDGDGETDLLVTSVTGQNVTIFIGNGDGSFNESEPQTAPAASFSMEVIAADFSGNGKMWIATPGLGDSKVHISKPFMSGLWIEDASYAVGAQPQSMAAADIDRDGDVDIVTGDQFGEGLSVLLNNGDGSFADFTAITTGVEIGSLTLQDVNNDGSVDIIAGSLSGNNIVLLLGAGDGTFTDLTVFDAGTDVNDIAVNDINGDGFPDIIAVGDNNITFFINALQSPEPPASVDLSNEADSGISDSDKITNFNNSAQALLAFEIHGVQIGNTVKVYADSTLVAEGVAQSTNITLTGNGVTLNDGTYVISATQAFPAAGVESAPVTGNNLVVDTAAPVFTTPDTITATADVQLQHDINTNEDANGVEFILIPVLDYISIDPETGILTWTPHLDDVGNNEIHVSATDIAGNWAAQILTVSVDPGDPRPDLTPVVDSSAVFTTLVPGDKKAKAIVTIANIGDANANGIIGISLYASADSSIDSNDIFLGSTSKKINVKVNANKKYKVKLFVPGTAEAGTYNILTRLDTSQITGDRRSDNDTDAASETHDIAWRFGSFDDRRNVKLLVDDGGTLITFKMSGSGFGEITGGTSLTTLTLNNINNSNLKITSAGNTSFDLNDVVINGSLKSFKARTATVIGDLIATGTMGTVQIAGAIGTVSTLGISNLKLTDDSSGVWTIGTSGLNKASIAGSILGGEFNVTGSTGNFTIKGSVAAAADLTFSTIHNFKISGNMLANVNLTHAGKVTIGGRWSGSFSASESSSQAVGKFTVKGDSDLATLSTMGSIGTVTLGNLHEVYIYAGVDTNALTEIGDLPTEWQQETSIDRVKVKGETKGATFAASEISNLTLDKISPQETLAIAATSSGKVTMILDGTRNTFKGNELFENTPALPYLDFVQI